MEAPFEVVIGSTDPAATTRFFQAFGFEEVAPGSLRVPGAASGGIAIEHQGSPRRGDGPHRPRNEAGGRGKGSDSEDPYASGPSAIDIYTRSIDEASDRLADWHLGQTAVLELGPVVLKQRRVVGPDGVTVVLVETDRRRSSVLDTDPDRLCSEVHSVVWCVMDLDAERQWWADRGWAAGPAFGFELEALSDLLDLPDRPVTTRMTMLSDEAVSPIRLELMEFPGRGTHGPDGFGRPGIRGLRAVGAAGGWVESPGGICLDEVEAV